MYVYIYTYIYIYRERERYAYMCVYIYIYVIYIHDILVTVRCTSATSLQASLEDRRDAPFSIMRRVKPRAQFAFYEKCRMPNNSTHIMF